LIQRLKEVRKEKEKKTLILGYKPLTSWKMIGQLVDKRFIAYCLSSLANKRDERK
jgi:hypothetical protein